MRIEQRRVTTLDLLDGKPHDIAVRIEDRGYRLTLASKEESVCLLLSSEDLAKLHQVIASAKARESATGFGLQAWESVRAEVTPPKETKKSPVPSYSTPVDCLSCTDEWVAFN